MAKKKQAAPAVDEVLREGPSPEEQAMVDAEQREIMAERKKVRDEEEKAERANYAGKLERAAAAQKKRVDLEAAVAAMSKILADQEKRLQALEAK
jgi:hypothetical protein